MRFPEPVNVRPDFRCPRTKRIGVPEDSKFACHTNCINGREKTAIVSVFPEFLRYVPSPRACPAIRNRARQSRREDTPPHSLGKCDAPQPVWDLPGNCRAEENDLQRYHKSQRIATFAAISIANIA